MPLLIDLLAALGAAAATFGFAHLLAGSALPPGSGREAARTMARELKQHGRLRRLLARRLNREALSGLLLTVALAVTVIGGLVLGILALLVRRVAAIQHVDNSVASWGYDHRTATSTHGLNVITQLGGTRVVVVLALVLVLVDLAWKRSRWSFLFVFVALVGMELISVSVKDLVGRLRPTLNPETVHLGPSFPSGHSGTAAVFYAAAALVASRWLSSRTGRHLLAAAAVAIAVAVAGSRVLIDVHWLSDVIGGLGLGWAWFALCSVVFGGRLLRPTAAAETVQAETQRVTSKRPVSSR